MSDSAKYPGLCKPYETERNSGNEYVELDYNSINAQQNPSTYFTYKTYNTEYDNERMVGTSSSTRNNVQSSLTNQNHNTNANNEVNSYSKIREQKTTNQQQYGNQQSYQSSPNPSPQQQQQQPNRYQASAFQQAFMSHQQQQLQKRPIDKTNPFHTYRWDLLFKNYL